MEILTVEPVELVPVKFGSSFVHAIEAEFWRCIV